jgi:hypothetical protein
VSRRANNEIWKDKDTRKAGAQGEEEEPQPSQAGAAITMRSLRIPSRNERLSHFAFMSFLLCPACSSRFGDRLDALGLEEFFVYPLQLLRQHDPAAKQPGLVLSR